MNVSDFIHFCDKTLTFFIHFVPTLDLVIALPTLEILTRYVGTVSDS